MNDWKTREKGPTVSARRNLQTVGSGYVDYNATIVTPEEYRYLYGGSRRAAAPQATGPRKAKRRWRFRPHSLGALLIWAVILFAGIRILVTPLVGGAYLYFAKDYEIHRLQSQYQTMRHQLTDMKKDRNKMKTMAYVEERGHQIGLIKSNESKMVVVESGDGKVAHAAPRQNEVFGY